VTIRVGVLGAGGRMGRTVCQAVAGEPDLALVAAVDPHLAGAAVRDVTGADCDVDLTADVASLGDAGAEVAVDFTVADAARANAAWCAAQGVHAVVGTTGLDDDDLAAFEAAFTTSNCIVAPNFTIGAVLMMAFAAQAAPFFETAEVIELHHDGKIDAPSGTAMTTIQRMAAASPDWAPDPTEREVVAGARGGKGPGGIPVHSVRLRGLFAHQEVILGTAGQSLTIRHDSFDRTAYMPGVLLAVREVARRPGLTVGLEPLLGL
jgi:4-hydroxy-tetrahydrodipicolinate reductase